VRCSITVQLKTELYKLQLCSYFYVTPTLHNEELQDLCSLPDTIRMGIVMSRRVEQWGMYT
jgi:hypothetical protein